MKNEEAESDAIIINEIQLLLAEKRTSLATMRAGITVLALPLSVMSVLIATSKFYDALHVVHFLIPIGILNLVLVILGVYLIIRSIIRIRNNDRLIHEIKLQHSIIGKFID